MKKISVVVPTYNRGKLLSKVLDRLVDQTVNKAKYEVIVVDNNSDDNTKEVVGEYVEKYPDLFKYFLQKKRGASPTRNLGAEKAETDLILFMDDDMLACKELVEQHLTSHANFEGSVLGYFENSWGESDSMFLKYLRVSGAQNIFPFEDDEEVNYHYFYTGNISVRKKAFQEVGGFDEGFKVYGVEDIDLGYRLSVIGEKCLYNAHAISFHDYHPEFDVFFKKQFHAGYSLGYFIDKYPHLDRYFSFGKRATLVLGGLNFAYRAMKPILFSRNEGTLTKHKRKYFNWTLRWNKYKGYRKFFKDKKIQKVADLLN